MTDKPLENIGQVRLAEAPDINSPAAPVSALPLIADAGSDEEQALLHVIRLLNRSAISPGVSPVERAFLIGAKAMFDELATTCQELLDEADSAPVKRVPATPDQEPVSASPADRPKRRTGRRSGPAQ